jgi:hypothetical protein
MTKIKGSCKVGDFSKAFKETLQNYTKEVEEGLAKVTVQLAKNAAKDINQAAYDTFNSSGSTGYYRGWTAKNESVRHHARWVIHNKEAPGLAHLLEHGHAQVDGGRTPGRIHIKPIEEKLIKDYEENVQAIIENGGY